MKEYHFNIHTRLFDEIHSLFLFWDLSGLAVKFINKADSEFYGYIKSFSEIIRLYKQKQFSICHTLKVGKACFVKV